MENKLFQFYDLTITLDPDKVDDGRHYNLAMRSILEGAYMLFMTDDATREKELLALVAENPQEPALWNFLYGHYRQVGMTEKATEINKQLLKDFPHYFFAQMNQAYEFIKAGQLNMAREILGDSLELADKFPNRTVFHVGEVVSYLQTVASYLIASGDFKRAKDWIWKLEGLSEQFSDDIEITIFPLFDDLKFAKIKSGIATDDIPLPELKRKELYQLYCHSMRIDPALITEILALPAEDLTHDLAIIIRNSYEKLQQWQELAYDPRIMEHPVHALNLITLKKDERDLPVVLDFLAQPQDVIEFWISDLHTEDYWKYIVATGMNRFDDLMEFMIRSGVCFSSRGAVSQAMNYIAIFHPEKRNDVIAWYRKLLTKLNEDPVLLNDDEFPADLILADLTEIKAIELQDLMIEIYGKIKTEADTMLGSQEEMVNSLHDDDDYTWFKPIPETAAALYDQFLDTWHYYKENNDLEDISAIREGIVNDDDFYNVDDEDSDDVEFPDEDDDEFYEEPFSYQMPIIKPPEPGRNDPCICGSGKKYKHCCMIN